MPQFTNAVDSYAARAHDAHIINWKQCIHIYLQKPHCTTIIIHNHPRCKIIGVCGKAMSRRSRRTWAAMVAMGDQGSWGGWGRRRHRKRMRVLPWSYLEAPHPSHIQLIRASMTRQTPAGPKFFPEEQYNAAYPWEQDFTRIHKESEGWQRPPFANRIVWCTLMYHEDP